MDLNINPNWTYKDMVKNVRALRTQYEGILCSFSYFHKHDKVKFIKETRKKFYSLGYDDYRKNIVWEYMNHCEPYCRLKELTLRCKK